MKLDEWRSADSGAVSIEPLEVSRWRGGDADELWVFSGRYWGELMVGGSRQRGDTVEDCDRRRKRGWAGQALRGETSLFGRTDTAGPGWGSPPQKSELEAIIRSCQEGGPPWLAGT
jgi:hypothetical protein